MTTELTASRGSVESSKEALMRDLKSVMRDADALLKEVGNTTAEGIAVARGKVEAKVDAVKFKLTGTRDAVAEKTRQAADTTQAYVKDNPWKIVGVAVLAGLVAGVLTTRR